MDPQTLSGPPVLGVVGASCVLLSAVLAERASRGDQAADRFFVMTAATLAAGSTVFVSWALKALLPRYSGEIDDYYLLVPTVQPALWLILVGYGTLVLLIRRAIGTAIVQDTIRRGRQASPQVLEVSAWCRGALDVRGSVPVIVSESCHGPFVTGAFRPVIVLPAEVEGMTRLQQEQILLHEFAHIARRDPLAQLGHQLASSLLWWNPLFWFVQRKASLVRESACDEIAMRYGTDPRGYADLLYRYASATRHPLTLGIGLGLTQVRMASWGTIEPRLEMVQRLSNRADRWPVFLPSTATRLDVVAVCAVAVVACGALDLLIFG